MRFVYWLTTCIFFCARMAATTPDMQKMHKKGMTYTRKVEVRDTPESTNLKNWFTSKPLKPGAMPCEESEKSKQCPMTEKNN